MPKREAHCEICAAQEESLPKQEKSLPEQEKNLPKQEKNLPKQGKSRAERKKRCKICAERMNGGKLRKTIFGGKT